MGLGHVDDLLGLVALLLARRLAVLVAVVAAQGLLHVVLLPHVEVLLRVGVVGVALPGSPAHLRVGGGAVKPLLGLLLDSVGEKVRELLEEVRVVSEEGRDLDERGESQRG